ncbi:MULTISPECIES: fatty acid desaturase [unclassified Sphingomonas]|uniref:acyl-CoA desaturase n=1 Tax=unclassified Sphingomonas TaxID=196159 RepID=UPI0028659158|nr:MULTISPECIES: fatty acid desaturase [unclassified Sphingomonas]MDR6116517.1 stearoyl-CoA desaturase (delta-9 desaturase) [Sphingomonas sp. SORGH_AS_0789]MDR6149808.1 stearoyl-CoA desaturase (delta-9 desaturase) [Sphingomonas sp. SORGH_AS_0742]
MMTHAPVADLTGRRERQLAWLTVGIPTLGAIAALAIAWVRGIGWLEIGALTSMYFITALGVEVGMHRFFSHRAFQAGPLVTAWFGITGSMAAQGPILFWAATHRQHHAFTDTEGDPHSPRPLGEGFVANVKGWWHAHLGWLFSLRRQNWSAFVPDLLRDRQMMWLNQHYYVWILLGLLAPALVCGLISHSLAGALTGFLWGGLLRIFLVDHATWCINSFAHRTGRREHSTRDTSRNVFWLALPTVGGGWHNNHHAFPALAHTGLKPWQFDVGGLFIELLASLGLVWGVKRPGSPPSPAEPKRVSPLRQHSEDSHG